MSPSPHLPGPTSASAPADGARSPHPFPPGITPDVFISYSRKDKEFVQSLYAAFVELQRNTWVDWEDIMPTENWWQAIEKGIESANNFVFILSPDSVASAVCSREVDHAVRHNKRLIPVVYRDVDAGAVHPALGAHNWLFMKQGEEFAAGFLRLIAAIDTDLPYVRAHTRLLINAVEWDQAGRDSSFLLRGKGLLAAEDWLRQAEGKEPQPTVLQRQLIQTSRQAPLAQPKKRTVMLTSALAAIVLSGAHTAGYLQKLELPVLDRVMQLRPAEPPDPRLLVIEMTEADVQDRVKRDDLGKGTLSDTLLLRVLTQLEPLKPAVIGLDFYRDFPVDRRLPALAKRLRASDRFIAVCKYAELDAQGREVGLGVSPPPEVPPQQVGFSDALLDEDTVLRRQLVLNVPATDNPLCAAPQSFSLLLARRYLELKLGPMMPYQDPLQGEHASLKINQVELPALALGGGGYQDTDGGYQLMLNYRTVPGGTGQMAQRVSLGAVLSGKLSPQEVRDRIVLIGVTSKSGVNDYVLTPTEVLPGVVAQAAMVSQVVSAVLDGRPLIHPWAPWAEALWIVGWAGVGGLIVYVWQSPLKLGLVLLGGLGGLLGVSYILLVQVGAWVPMVPGVLALLLTSGGVFYITLWLQQRRIDHRIESTLELNRPPN
jgi:CHASE2 domain-containing sensor protein